MRFFGTFLSLLAAICLTVGCYENKPAPKYPIEGAVDVSQPVPGAAAVNTSVKHYICSNNCAGSGGDAAGNCPVCGNAYTHNDAYHNNTAAPTPSSTTESANSTVNFTDPNAAAEPAQNAAGVWHYTCSAGCAGGAGSAGNCASCGGALAHNAAYHN